MVGAHTRYAGAPTREGTRQAALPYHAGAQPGQGKPEHPDTARERPERQAVLVERETGLSTLRMTGQAQQEDRSSNN
jgi:hypothetical protein